MDTTYLERCIAALERAYHLLKLAAPESVEYDMYRSACVKEFEIILEQSGKLLKKILKPYFHTPREADRLFFKDIFRHALLRGLIDDLESERWLKYRDNRNNTAHDYGEKFAEETVLLLPEFIADAKRLAQLIKNQPETE